MIKFALVIPVLLYICNAVAFALPHEECGGSRECGKCHTLSVEEANRLMSGVGEVKDVKVSAIPGLFEVTVATKERQAVTYVDFGKKFLVAGPIFDITTKKQITEQPKGIGETQNPPTSRTLKFESIPVTNSITMGNPKGKKKLFVFTDPDCPYCAKLHWELVKLMYMEPDLTIYVKMFPLTIHPTAYDKARVILGSDSLFLLDKAFAGEQLPAPGPKDLASPVDETIRLAGSLGITATPTLVLPDGRIVPGFREAAKIKDLLSGGK